MDYYVISFSNTHSALSTEKYLKNLFKIIIMPTPREISKGCGISVKFYKEDYDSIIEKLNAFNLKKDLYSIHHYLGGVYTKIY